jgi:hypothetical protein
MIPGTHFCKRLSQHQGDNVAGIIRSMESNDMNGSRTRDLLACSIASQRTTRPRAPFSVGMR